MRYKLFLDDIREVKDPYLYTGNKIYLTDNWIIVRNYEEFCELIKSNGLPDIVSFDHDLADIHYLSMNNGDIDYENTTEKTGYHCAKWMLDYIMDKDLYNELPSCYIHSINRVGMLNIYSLITTFIKIYKNKINHL